MILGLEDDQTVSIDALEGVFVLALDLHLEVVNIVDACDVNRERRSFSHAQPTIHRCPPLAPHKVTAYRA